ncbi:Uncharacterised protein [Starkeya nomas]|uniref:Polyketide cyclase / dehydrase and lipid transport n=1 Tax=Starkeya nomas TaxID=2666134 RepID=A0A5S9NJA2_9HYPH|nr:SRPBCC family protein [Starkeya nomas]CAA0090187.1 Uncharacterised protein [Starkeya nomas]
MAHVYFSKILDVPANSAWQIVRDFGALPIWFPFVKRSELRGGGPHEVGTIRANTVADDSIIEERLLELSDRDRRIVYDIVKADIPTKNYSAVLQIHEVTNDQDRCFAEWSADFDVEGNPATAIEWVRDGIFKTCLEELESVVRSRKSV